MLALYNKDFTTKYGAINSIIEAFVEEERNGLFELSFVMLNTDSLFNYIKEDNIVVANANNTLVNQKFRIYMTRKLMNNRVEVFARHISFDLMYDYIDNISFDNQSCEYALNLLFRNSNFSSHYKGYSDIINAQNYNMSMANVLEAIGGKEGALLDTFGTGAELLRDNENIHVLNKRGHDNSVSIEYKKNLTGFELEEDTTDLVTRILPYARYTPEGGEEVTIKASFVDSPLISNYSHPFIKAIDYTDKFEEDEEVTTSKLITFAQNEYKVNKVDIPKQNFKIEFIPLSKCVGYEGLEDNISLCDTVTILDTRYNVNTQAKVIKTVFNVLKNRYESMELGEPKTSLGDIIGSNDSSKGEKGDKGDKGDKGEDGSVGDFPNSLPATPIVTTKVYGFANIEISWTFENKVYYQYEVYASKEANFTPNTFNLVHKGQTSTYMYQAKPNETWYFKVCAINTHGDRTNFGTAYATTVKINDLSNYVGEMAIGDALIGELNLGRGWVGTLKGNHIDAKNLSVTNGNGKRTLDIDSYGNVSLDVASLKISSSSVATENYANTKATQALNDSKTYTTTQITATNNKVASIETNLDSITQRVSSTESTNVTLTEKVSATVKDVKVYYAINTSSTTAPTSGWSTTPPTWAEGKYMWSKTTTTLTNGQSTTTNPVCITGAKGATGATGDKGDKGDKGDTGATGTGIQSITTEYYLSTSKTTQTGGSWVTTQPTWSNGKYLWTRSKIVYKNPNSTAYTTPVCDSSYDAINDVEVGGRNLFLNSKTVLLNVSDNGNNDKSVVENGVVKITPKNNGNVYNTDVKTSETREQGVVYTLSFEILTNDNIGFYWYPSESYIKRNYIVASSSWQKVSFTYKQIGSDSNTAKLFGFNGLVGGNTYYYKNLKLERGNKATDWTPAPEDVQIQIDANTTQLSTTNSKVSSLETNLNGITSRVSNVEIKQTTTNNDLTSLTTRVTSTETKLTQTEKDFNFKIENVGAENLIKNSDFSAGIEQWEKNGHFTWHIPVSGSEISYNYGKMICIQNSGGGVGIFQRFNTITGQKYTVSFYTEGAQQKPTDTVIGIEGVKTVTLNVEPYFKRWSFTFTATSNRHTFIAYLGTAGKFYLGRVMVTQGTVLQEYRKHTSEIYSSTVKIDVDGIEIDSTGANTINKINTNGMIIKDKSNNTDLLKATSSGVVARGGSFYVDDPSNGYTRLWGRDIDINGQRALVGTNSSPQGSLIANKLYINYGGDFKNGTEITGKLTNNSFNVLSDVGSSITQNGYMKLSNGLIIQWGHVKGLTISNGRVVDAHIKYPIDFPNAIITFIPSIDTVDGNNYIASRYNILGKTNNNRTHGWVYSYNWTDSPQGALMDINYIAIGC